MRKFILLLSAFSLSSAAWGWGAPDLLPAGDRSKTYELTTKQDKKKGFAKLSIWAAKTFADSNESIKMKDVDLGVLVVKGNLSCKALKIGNGYGENQRLELSIEATIEDKKLEIKVTDVLGRANGAYDDAARPSTKDEMATAVKECIDPFVNQIKTELN